MIKIGRPIVELLKINTLRSTNKRNKKYPGYGQYEEMIDVPYIDDNEYHHKFDVLYGKGEKKNCLIIDIHGGSYILGDHRDQYVFGCYFAEKGYDFIAVDYIPNDGKRDVKDSLDDVYKNLVYVFTHLKELKLENDDIIITGDSAGGHMALTMSQAICDKEYAKKLGYDFGGVSIKACLANCPVYDFVHLGDDNLTRSGMKRLFGPRCFDKEHFALLSPKENIASLTCPTFVSTCTKDFLRGEAMKLKEDMKERNVLFEYLDVKSDKAGHVHNVLHPYNEDGEKCNTQMVEFIEKARKR